MGRACFLRNSKETGGSSAMVLFIHSWHLHPMDYYRQNSKKEKGICKAWDKDKS